MKKLSVDELTRLAFKWAEESRTEMAEAYDKATGGGHGNFFEDEARDLRQYRLKRWGPDRTITFKKKKK